MLVNFPIFLFKYTQIKTVDQTQDLPDDGSDLTVEELFARHLKGKTRF